MQPELRTQQAVYQPGAVQEISLQQQKVLRNTYLLLAVTMVPTVTGAAIGTSIVDFSFMRASPILSSLAVLAIFYGWIFMIERNRDNVVGLGLLLGFTLFLGILLGPLFQIVLGLKNGVQLVMMAAGGTGAAFLVLSGVAATTRRDFGFLGKFLLVGFVVIMLAVLANIFLASPVLHLTLCALFILFSSAVILYQLNSIVRGGETNYISATLTIYVALYNIFTSLLQLLGILGGDRD
jgi:modulator of FtsH protease